MQMSIESAFDRVINKIDQAYDAVNTKGGVVPSAKKLANLPTAIESIPTGSGGVSKLQEKTVTPSKSEQVVTADESYDALSKVTVKAIPEGSGDGGGGTGTINLQDKTVSPTTSSQTVTADSGYDGLSRVTVNAAPLQSKSVTPSTSDQNVTPDSSMYGLSQVNVGKIPEVYKDTSDATASASDILAGKTAYINGQKVTGTASASGGKAKLQAKTVVPTSSVQTVKPDSTYDGLSQVTVTGVPEDPVSKEYRWWSPNMTSNTTPAPYKLFGDSMMLNSYKILDNSSATIEALEPPSSLSTSIPELGLDFGIPVKIAGIKASAKTSANVSNNIKDIKILGNNTGPDTDFTLIKEQDVSSTMTSTKEVTITFNAAEYRYFKILFTEREVLSDRKVYVGDVTFYREFTVANLNLQAKTVNPSTSQQVVKADDLYDGLKEVTVTAVGLETKTVTPTTAAQTFTPTAGKMGFSSVTVDATPLQEKTINPSTSAQSVTPDAGKVGLSKVTVNAPALQDKTIGPAGTLQTVTPDAGKVGLSKVTVNAAVLQEKTVTPSGSAQSITPDSGKYGLSKVTVNAAALQEKTVTPSTSAQNVTPDSGKYGLSKVTVNAIPSTYKNTSDGTAAAGDILSGKTAYNASGKVTGTMASNTLATPTVSVNASGLITASVTQGAGYTAGGTKSATKQLTTKGAETITPGTSDKTIASGQYLTGVQTIKGDANLQAANIRTGVSIFGINGTVAGDKVLKGKILTLHPTDHDLEVTTADIPAEYGTDYDGFDHVICKGDANLSPSNIKKGVKIFTKTGTFGNFQSKTVAPATTAVAVGPDSGYDALANVTVSAIKKNVVRYDLSVAVKTTALQYCRITGPGINKTTGATTWTNTIIGSSSSENDVAFYAAPFMPITIAPNGLDPIKYNEDTYKNEVYSIIIGAPGSASVSGRATNFRLITRTGDRYELYNGAWTKNGTNIGSGSTAGSSVGIPITMTFPVTMFAYPSLVADEFGSLNEVCSVGIVFGNN